MEYVYSTLDIPSIAVKSQAVNLEKDLVLSL